MAGFTWPENPAFESHAERLVWDALRKNLRDGDALLAGLRFSHRSYGDVEIDLTVFLYDQGVVTIEVKGGHISYANGSWRGRSGTGASYTLHPTDQARKARYVLREFLTTSPRWSRGALRDGWMLALPNTDVTADLAPDAPRRLVLGRGDMNDALGKVFDVLHDPANASKLSAHGWVESALDLLLHRGEPLRDVMRAISTRTREVERLTGEQGTILDMFADNQRIEVHGNAGSGKTWLAFEQCRRWAAEGKRVALLSFGRGLATALSVQAAALPAGEQPAFVGTFHQLGSAWGVVAEPNAPSVWWNEAAPELMDTAACALPAADQFDALVVDEAQDFADSWWLPLLSALADPASARIATFRDDGQAVFGRRGRPDLPFAQVSLQQNLRNTSQIGNVANSLTASSSKLLGGEGPPVRLVPCSTADAVDVASDEAVALLDKGWDAKDVALLTTHHRHPVQVEQQAEGAEEYWSNLWTGDDIFYGTVVGFKGLERPAVVVAVDGFRAAQDAKELMYVATSRARDQLIVVGDPDLIRHSCGNEFLKRLSDPRG